MTAAPFEPIPLTRLAGAEIRPAGDDYYVLWKPARQTHRLIVAGGREPPCFNAIVLPVDCAFETRLHTAGRFWRQLDGRVPGPDYGVFPPRSRQLAILTLRMFDGRRAGATYREMADELLADAPIEPRDWRDHPLKHRVREFLRKADRLVYRGGYRDLLFYPHRRGKRR